MRLEYSATAKDLKLPSVMFPSKFRAVGAKKTILGPQLGLVWSRLGSFRLVSPGLGLISIMLDLLPNSRSSLYIFQAGTPPFFNPITLVAILRGIHRGFL